MIAELAHVYCLAKRLGVELAVLQDGEHSWYLLHLQRTGEKGTGATVMRSLTRAASKHSKAIGLVCATYLIPCTWLPRHRDQRNLYDHEHSSAPAW
jgi:hypothetical protein